MLSEQNLSLPPLTINSSNNKITHNPVYQHRFESRKEVVKLLARFLKHYHNAPDTIVLAIKPSATIIAHEIAKELNVPLDLFLIRCDISQELIDSKIAEQRAQLQILHQECNPPNLPLPESENANIILVTDGIKTGQDARNTISILKSLGYNGKIILSGGVIGSDAQKRFMKKVYNVVAVKAPQIVGSVESWYEDGHEHLTNAQIKQLLSNKN
nr:2000_t:CDS:2 [Entrophospora candida]